MSGARLASLRDEGVLIIGSGSFTHDLSEFRGHGPNDPAPDWVNSFADWFDAALTKNADRRAASTTGGRRRSRPRTIRPKSICCRCTRRWARREKTRAPSGFTPARPTACCGWTCTRSKLRTIRTKRQLCIEAPLTNDDAHCLQNRGWIMTEKRPADIVSPITDIALPDKVSFTNARSAGRVGHDEPTSENSIVLLIDHQIGLMAGVRDFTSIAEYKKNVVGLARVAKALKMPVLITSSNAQWQNGDTLPEIKEIFSDQPIYRRTGIINAYEDPSFRKAFENWWPLPVAGMSSLPLSRSAPAARSRRSRS